MFYSTGPSGTNGTGVYPILSDSQSDTIVITRNILYNIDNSNYSTDVIGIALRSFNAGSVVRIHNNFIAMNAANPSVEEIFGIEFGTNSANNPFEAEVYYNTIVMGGTAIAGTAGTVNSAALSVFNSDSLVKLNVRNNIFINKRTGGLGQHLAISRIETFGSNTFDYNTYGSATSDFGRIGATAYPTLNAFQAASAPNEVHSNAEQVFFISATDLHLSGASLGDTNLYGINIPSVTLDFDGHPRLKPYRGADEVDDATILVDVSSPAVLQLFPIPVTEQLTVKLDKVIPRRVAVFNVTGALLFSEENLTSRTLSIDMRSYAPGIYVVRIDVDGSVISKRITVSH
jgi:hypothetical protein